MNRGTKGLLFAGGVVAALVAGAWGVIHLVLGQGQKSRAGASAGATSGMPAVVEPSGPIDQTLADAGDELVATKGCLTCHSTDGSPGTAATWKGLWGSTVRLEGGRRAVVNKAFTLRSMSDPLAEVHEGYVPQMPAYKGMLTVDEMNAIVEYIRSLGTDDQNSAG